MLRARRMLLALGLAATCGTCSGRSHEGVYTVTVYTSIYENVIAALDPELEEAFPDIDVRWYQKGSEEVAAKVAAEIAAGDVKADIIMTSDPFWYQELKEAGYLLTYTSPRAEALPEELVDPEHAFVTVRMPVMVLAVHWDRITADQRPRTFRDLKDPRLAGRVVMGDPNRSGSFFTAVAALSRRYGWEYFDGLRRNEILVAGGNSAVLDRVASGERVVGMVLLENLLKAKEENPLLPVEIIYPEDGAVLVPSPIAVMRATRAPEAAKRIYDFFLSDQGQRAIVGGWMYSPFDHIPAPAHARPWPEIHRAPLVPWSAEYLHDTKRRREEIKREFTRIVLE